MKQHVEYPNYVWITPGWYPNQWWADEQDSMPTGCRNDTLEAFIRGTIAISHYYTNVNESTTTVSGMVRVHVVLYFDCELKAVLLYFYRRNSNII